MAELDTSLFNPTPMGGTLDHLTGNTDPYSLPPQLQKNLTDIAQRKSSESKNQEEELKENISDDRRQMHKAFNAESYDLENMPPKWNAEQESEKFSTSPIAAFGSLASVLGIMAASFTHAPLMNSLNASAAAMNAIKSGNEDAYNKAHQAWKDNTDLFFKRHALMQEQYSNAMNMMRTNVEAGRALAEATAIKFGDEKTLAFLRNGMDPDWMKLAAARDQSAIKLQLQASQIEANLARANVARAGGAGRGGADAQRRDQLYQQGVAEAEKKKVGPLTFEEKKKIQDEVYGRGALSGRESLDLESKIDLFQNSLDVIDRVNGVLDKYVGSAGLAGRGTRLAERVGNVFGRDETARTQMMRDIEYLQSIAPQLLHDRVSGRPLSAEAANISDIIAGLNIGDTTKNTITAMQTVKQLYSKMRQENLSRLQGTWTPEGGGATSGNTTATPSQSAQPWLNDPLAK